MTLSERFFSLHVLLCTLAMLLLTGTAARSAFAQEVLVQNGATLQVSNGGAYHLQGSTMDFGDAGATARLKETSKGRVTDGTLRATRALNSPSQVDPAGLGAKISASVDLGIVTVIRGHEGQTENGNTSIKRYYDIKPSKNNSGLSATLVHAYADAELAGLSESTLEVFKSTDGGSTWSEEGYDRRDPSANSVTLSGIESFSRWTLGSSSSPLPVELAQFEGTAVEKEGGEVIRLTWSVAAEQGNAGFAIERKPSESGSWTQVGYHQSKAPGGTSRKPRTYRFTDEGLPYGADTLEYRLRQVDTDGTAHRSAPITVAQGIVETLQLKETFPNPARSRVTVRYAIPETAGAGQGTLRLYDVLGRKVRTAETQVKAGRHEATFDLSGLPSGVYLLRLAAGGEAQTRRLTVVR